MSKNTSFKPILFNYLNTVLIIVLFLIINCFNKQFVNSFKLFPIYDLTDGETNVNNRSTTAGVTVVAVSRQHPTRQVGDNEPAFSRPLNRPNRAVADPQVVGFKVEADSKHEWVDNGLQIIRANAAIDVRLFGTQLNVTELQIGFTTNQPNGKQFCQPINDRFKAKTDSDFMAVAEGVHIAADGVYYMCFTYSGKTDSEGIEEWQYVIGAQNTWMRIKVEGPMIPLWLQIILIILLLLLSGLFSGLNLGLMALDKNELKVIERCGTEVEKNYAKQITPVRKRGNYLLCTLLLGNVLVNSTLTIFLDDLTSGIVAVIASTLSIVIFGEIIPQALCSRHGLAVGAKTVWLTYLFMVATFPLSFPISKILDKVLGEEIGNVYDRERLMEYIRVTKDHNRLDADEVNIISGALKLSKIKVVEIMTQINDVFMLPYNTILDFKTLTAINNTGYSRIPVFDSDRNDVVGILHAKDLAFTDPDNNMPIKALIEFYKHPLYFVYEDVTLDVMLNEFKQGKSHMAFVRKIIDDGINDPRYELAGVVTLEDVIEELIQAEINDETDVISDNRRKQKRKEVVNRPNYSDFVRLGGGLESAKTVSSQLALAAFRYLSTFVKPFTEEFISSNVLKRLMAKKVYFEVSVDPTLQFDTIDRVPPEYRLYTYGKAADYFILILEGRVKVIIGKENQTYEAGPFVFFGTSALKSNNGDNDSVSKSASLGRLSITDVQVHQTQEPTLKTSPSTTSTGAYRSSISIPEGSLTIREGTFIPDYTVYCIENTSYLKITRAMYLAAIRTTIMERQRQSDSHSDDGITHFGNDLNAESTTNLLSMPTTRSELTSNKSTASLTTSKQSANAVPKPNDSTAPADAVDAPPKYEDQTIANNSITNKSNLNSLSQLNANINNENLKQNSTESIDSSTKRNSSPTDEKSHLI